MERIHPRLVRILVLLALVAAAAFGGHGKDWLP